MACGCKHEGSVGDMRRVLRWVICGLPRGLMDESAFGEVSSVRGLP